MRKPFLICLTLLPAGAMTQSALALRDDLAAGAAGLAVSAIILFIVLWLAFRTKADEARRERAKPSIGDCILRMLAAVPAAVCLLFAFATSFGLSTFFVPPQLPPGGWLGWHTIVALLAACGEIAMFTYVAAWMGRYVVTGKMFGWLKRAGGTKTGMSVGSLGTP